MRVVGETKIMSDLMSEINTSFGVTTHDIPHPWWQPWCALYLGNPLPSPSTKKSMSRNINEQFMFTSFNCMQLKVVQYTR